MVKITNQKLSIIVERLNMLLQQIALPQLGFAEGIYPEESWVMRVVRYIDRVNLLGCYVRGIRNVVEPNIPAMRV